LTLAEIEALKLSQTTGVYITVVTAGGPADAAGLRAGDRPTSIEGLSAGGDLIISIDGHPLRTFSDLLSYLVNKTSVGQTVTLTVLRDGEQQNVAVTLGARP
jgi:2-alkenal reductase